MPQRFNQPPNWPAPPAGWTPPKGWQPDPSWPDPPEGWELWIDEPGTASKLASRASSAAAHVRSGSQLGDPSEPTLWEGVSSSAASVVTGGRVVAARYRLTPTTLHFERGVVSTDAQQIPLHTVQDVDLRQTMTQKARSVGDVDLHVIREHGQRETVTLSAVRDPRDARDAINRASAEARDAYQSRRATSTVQHVGQPGPQQPAEGKADVMAQLRQLGELRDAGVVTDEEFAAKKADLLGRL